jgi:hypothetical protein
MLDCPHPFPPRAPSVLVWRDIIEVQRDIEDNARTESIFATLKKEKLYQIRTEQMPMAQVQSIALRYLMTICNTVPDFSGLYQIQNPQIRMIPGKIKSVV